MSSNYDESFENSSGSDAPHNMKLSIDINSVRNMQSSGNVFVQYSIQLQDTKNF